MILILTLFLCGAGIVSFTQLNIEAYPDPVPPLVEVIAQSSGQSAEEIERYITIPIEIQMGGIPHVTSVRTISLFGLSGDMVKGIVLMRRGAKSLPTLRGVEAEVQKINSTGILPPGVRLEKLYDRSDLIAITTQTVLHNLVAGVVLIFVIQWIFLGNLRSAIVVATTIPFALFFAIIIMQLQGESANLLSVGAIDFGLIVDATVIMAENIYRHLIISYFNRLVEGDLDRSAALLQACQMRLRPVMMTCMAACVGLLPAAVSNGIGAQVQKPLALVVVGGSLLAPGLILIVLPVSIDVFSRRGRRTTPSAAPTPEPVR
jgi:heavy metal efflux system protein